MTLKTWILSFAIIVTSCSTSISTKPVASTDQAGGDGHIQSPVEPWLTTTLLTTIGKPTIPSAGFQDPYTTTSSPTFNVTPSPSTTEPAPFILCSPLEPHPLDVLPKIISDPYKPPPPGKDERHHGVDFSYYHFEEFSTIHGTTVQSVLEGVVAAALDDSFPYGNAVILETPSSDLPEFIIDYIGLMPGESLYMLYAHLEESPRVSMGDLVPACMPLGKVGKSGNAVVSHLHLETRIGHAGATFPVMANYKKTITPDEKQNYLLWRISGEFRHFDPMFLLGIEWASQN